MKDTDFPVSVCEVVGVNVTESRLKNSFHKLKFHISLQLQFERKRRRADTQN